MNCFKTFEPDLPDILRVAGLKTKICDMKVWLHWCFTHPDIVQFLKVNISFDTTKTDVKYI